MISRNTDNESDERLIVCRRTGPFVDVGKGLRLAAAQRYGQYCHITPDGKPAYEQRYDGVGKFVRVGNKLFLAVVSLHGNDFHIKPDGKPAYGQTFSRVAEDFKKIRGRYRATVSVGDGDKSLGWWEIDPRGEEIQKRGR